MSDAADRPLSEWSIEDRIVAWRESARREARRAEALEQAGGDPVESIRYASMASMYLAFAADADRFGELPEINDDEVQGG